VILGTNKKEYRYKGKADNDKLSAWSEFMRRERILKQQITKQRQKYQRCNRIQVNHHLVKILHFKLELQHFKEKTTWL